MRIPLIPNAHSPGTGAALRVLFLTVAFCAQMAHSELQQSSIAIADPNLESAIRDALNQPEGELTFHAMAQLSFLDASRRNITSLEGFVGATNLVLFDLSFNQLGSVLLPADLYSLQTLNLRGSQVNALAVRGPLLALRELQLSENAATNLLFLGQMPQLTTLWLQANDLEAFDPPIELLRLERLDLGLNRVTDLSFLRKLPGLRGLNLDDNGLSTVVFPSAQPGLLELSLGVNRIRDLSFLRQPPNLELLDLASNFSTSYQFPSGLSRLRWLNLGENRLTSVAFASDMTNLATLYLDDNRFTEVPSIAHLLSLATLDLGINQLTEVTIPHTITNLSQLVLRLNPLQTLILSDLLATNRLAAVVQGLTNQSVTVNIYPIVSRLRTISAAAVETFSLLLQGPPGIHELLRSEDLREWRVTGLITNRSGRVTIEIELAGRPAASFFRTILTRP